MVELKITTVAAEISNKEEGAVGILHFPWLQESLVGQPVSQATTKV